ncbi:MAG: hypothetical protein QOC72_3962 [Methylobacteriaceae bacterium]|jgi:hypothetical protein|nr:hypothetical protein [Methylobacteriaceae bacterium]
MANLVGMDCARDCTALASDIRKAGVKFVGRYYRWPKSKYTPLTYDEALALSQANLLIVALWEWASDSISNFSYHDGFDQGSSAYNQALKAHQPAGTPIYFAADSDFSAQQVSGAINDYFRGVAAAFSALGSGNSSYLIGVYGSGRTCDWLLNHKMAACTWLAVSSGWHGKKTFKDWDIDQGDDDLGISGLDYDSDIAKPSFGGFKVLA